MPAPKGIPAKKQKIAPATSKATASKVIAGTVLGSSASSAQGYLCRAETLLGPGGTDQFCPVDFVLGFCFRSRNRR